MTPPPSPPLTVSDWPVTRTNEIECCIMLPWEHIPMLISHICAPTQRTSLSLSAAFSQSILDQIRRAFRLLDWTARCCVHARVHMLLVGRDRTFANITDRAVTTLSKIQGRNQTVQNTEVIFLVKHLQHQPLHNNLLIISVCSSSTHFSLYALGQRRQVKHKSIQFY